MSPWRPTLMFAVLAVVLMCSAQEDDFLTQKLKCFQEGFDMDEDGYLDESDFIAVVNMFKTAAAAHFCGSDEERQLTIGTLLEQVFAADYIYTGVKTDPDQYADAMKGLALDDFFWGSLRPRLVGVCFYSLDIDNDGELDCDEFSGLLKGFRVPEDYFEATCEAVDRDHSGAISYTEAFLSHKLFYTSTNQTDPSKLFYGPCPRVEPPTPAP